MPRFNLTARASALAIIMLACLVIQTPAVSAQDTEAASRQFSAKAGEVVMKAQTYIAADEFTSALALLNEVQGHAELTPYERSIIAQLQGASYYQLDQYGPAILAFERAIAAGGLMPKEVDDMDVQIAQLMIANGQYRQGAEKLEANLNAGGTPKPQYIDMLMQAWIQAEDYLKALPWAEKWFAGARPKERKHFDLMNFLYNQMGQPERQIDIVKDMIQHWPSEKALWETWASLLAMNGQEEEAFEVNKQIYLSGFNMSERELMKMVQYYSYYEMPYQAAGLLEKEMSMGRISRSPEKLTQLSTLLRQAREYKRAIPILEEASKAGGTGKLYIHLGEALYNEGECARAENAFKQGIDQGYDAGKAWMLVATCRYEDVQKQQNLNCKMSDAEKAAAPKTQARQSTIAAFENVPLTSPQSRDAKKWISFITAERETFERRCVFDGHRHEKACYFDIKRAYDAQFLTGKLELNDADCDQYVTAYDREYRSKKAG